jgi:hypothetical protein
MDNIFEILLRLTRGDRTAGTGPATPSSLVGPLATAASPNSHYAAKQNHVSLAVLAMLRLTYELAEKAGVPSTEVNDRVSESESSLYPCSRSGALIIRARRHRSHPGDSFPPLVQERRRHLPRPPGRQEALKASSVRGPLFLALASLHFPLWAVFSTGRGYRRAFRCAPAGRQGRSTWVQLQCAGVSSSSCDGEGVEGASVVAQGRTRAQLGNMKTGVHLLSSPLALRIRLATRASSPLAPSRGRRTTSFTGRPTASVRDSCAAWTYSPRYLHFGTCLSVVRVLP